MTISDLIQFPIAGDKPGYFEAKLPDNVQANADLPVDNSEDNGAAEGRVVNEQVAMPPQNKQVILGLVVFCM